MVDSFEHLVQLVQSCTTEQKQRIFSVIRDSILIHALEREFGVRAEVILEAIGRATDLTQRGVRGLIAETVFVLDVIPTAKGWQSVPPIGNVSYDACLHKDGRSVRIQVKTQRRKDGQPMLRGDSYIVEVQRTRTGQRNGVDTRPYRFSDFDLLAVCMWASTANWQSFLYAPAARLLPDGQDKSIIKKMQPVPYYEDGDNGVWSTNLITALERAVGKLDQ